MLAFTMLIFILSPLVSLPFSLIGMVYNPQQSKKHVFLFALALSIISLHLEPLITNDGTRVLQTIANYSYLDLHQLYETERFLREPLTGFIYFIIGKIGTPKLIFSIGAFVQYYLLLYIIVDYANSLNVKFLYRLQAIFLVLSYHSYFSSVGSFRFYTATIICLFSWYLLTIKKRKRDSFILCITAALIHSSFYMQLLVMIVTLITWSYSKKTKVIKLFLLLWPVSLGVLMSFLERFSSIYLFEVSEDKLEVYSGLGLYNYVQFIFIISGVAMSIVFLLRAFRRNHSKLLDERIRTNEYYDLLNNYIFFTIGSLFINHYIFRRLVHLVVLATVIPIIMYGLNGRKKTILLFMENAVIFIASVTGFLYQLRILQPKFDITLGELFINNIFIFVYEVISGIL